MLVSKSFPKIKAILYRSVAVCGVLSQPIHSMEAPSEGEERKSAFQGSVAPSVASGGSRASSFSVWRHAYRHVPAGSEVSSTGIWGHIHDTRSTGGSSFPRYSEEGGRDTDRFSTSTDSMRSLVSDISDRAEAIVRKTSFLKEVPPHFFRYSVPAPYGDDKVWFSFSPQEGRGPSTLTELLRRLGLDRLHDENRLGIVLKDMDKVAPEAVADFCEQLLRFVEAASSPGTNLKDIAHTLAIQGPVPYTLLDHMERERGRWGWVHGLDLSQATWRRRQGGPTGSRPSTFPDILAESHLYNINLSHSTGMSSRIFSDIMNVLKRREAPFRLELKDTNLTPEMVTALRNLLKENGACVYLGLQHTGITGTSLSLLYEVLEDRDSIRGAQPLEIDINGNDLNEGAYTKWKGGIANRLLHGVISPSLPPTYDAYNRDQQLTQIVAIILAETDEAQSTSIELEGLGELSQNALKELCEGLLARPRISHLRLINTTLPSVGDRLWPLLPLLVNGQLDSLTLQNVSLLPVDLAVLGYALHTSPVWGSNLTDLNLSQNFMTGDAVAALKEVIKHAPRLRTLNLANNGLGQGSSALMAPLGRLSQLERLILRNNLITDIEARKLWGLLSEESQFPLLQQLNISYNPMNMELPPNKVRQGLNLHLAGVGMPENTLRSWQSHTKGAINPTTQSIQALWKGVYAGLPKNLQEVVKENPLSLFELPGRGNLLTQLRHVRLTREPLIKGQEGNEHLTSLFNALGALTSFVSGDLTPEMVPTIKALLERSPDIKSVGLRFDEDWHADDILDLLQSVPTRLQHMKLDSRHTSFTASQVESLLSTLGGFRNLQTLSLKMNDIRGARLGSDESLVNTESLHGLRDLGRITLKTPFLTVEDVIPLIEGNNLTSLHLDAISMDGQLEALAKSIPDSLTQLGLRKADLTEEDIPTLQTWLEAGLPRLERLSLAYNEGLEPVFVQLLTALQQATELRALNVSGWPVTANLKGLLKALPVNVPSLRTITIDNVTFKGENTADLRDQLTRAEKWTALEKEETALARSPKSRIRPRKGLRAYDGSPITHLDETSPAMDELVIYLNELTPFEVLPPHLQQLLENVETLDMKRQSIGSTNERLNTFVSWLYHCKNLTGLDLRATGIMMFNMFAQNGPQACHKNAKPLVDWINKSSQLKQLYIDRPEGGHPSDYHKRSIILSNVITNKSIKSNLFEEYNTIGIKGKLSSPAPYLKELYSPRGNPILPDHGISMKGVKRIYSFPFNPLISNFDHVRRIIGKDYWVKSERQRINALKTMIDVESFRGVSIMDIEGVKDLPNLKSLAPIMSERRIDKGKMNSYKNSTIHYFPLEELASLPQLEELFLSYSDKEDLDEEQSSLLKRLPRLKTLRVYVKPQDTRIYEALGQLPNLEKLVLLACPSYINQELLTSALPALKNLKMFVVLPAQPTTLPAGSDADIRLLEQVAKVAPGLEVVSLSTSLVQGVDMPGLIAKVRKLLPRVRKIILQRPVITAPDQTEMDVKERTLIAWRERKELLASGDLANFAGQNYKSYLQEGLTLMLHPNPGNLHGPKHAEYEYELIPSDFTLEGADSDSDTEEQTDGKEEE